ncbi:hypothetical protein [Leptospira johnsonii]|uniref:Uncharacterized protein n=1 Tax=Leptospira johnsonii TaxID=1917820 RepID=A0A2P2D1Q5_9LEPT|nr:hypothetical protein [Leptospira johnsonii]GBF38525.1 hypothetical protein LPTSP1_15180 [Leptospira johnsonii]
MLLHRALFAGAVSVTPALDVVNGGWRVATAKVFSSIATGYKVFMKVGSPVSLLDYDEVQEISGDGQRHVLFDTPIEGQTYYFIAVALQDSETSLPSIIKPFTENETVLFSKSSIGVFNFLVPQDIYVLNCNIVGGAGGPGGGGGGGANDFFSGTGGAGGNGGVKGEDTIFGSNTASGGSGGGGGGGGASYRPVLPPVLPGQPGTSGMNSTAFPGGIGGAGGNESGSAQSGGSGGLNAEGSWPEQPNWGRRNTFVPVGGAGRNSSPPGAGGGLGGSGEYLNIPNFQVTPGTNISGIVGNRGVGGAGGAGGSTTSGQYGGNGQTATGSNLGNPGGIQIKG